MPARRPREVLAVLLAVGSLLAPANALHAAQPRQRITDPGAFLVATEALRTRDPRLFAQQLARIHTQSPTLTQAQGWHLAYLDAYEASLDGNFSTANSLLRDVIGHSDNASLRAKASAVLMTNLIIGHRYEDAFNIAHSLTLELPEINDRDARFQVLSELSQMLNLAGQTDLAIKYARMMEGTLPAGMGQCYPQARLMAAMYSDKQLSSTSPELQQAIASCQGDGLPIMANAMLLTLGTLYLEEHQPSKTLALLDRIDRSVHDTGYYPHMLSAEEQRARAFAQLGLHDDARKAAQATVDMTQPDDVNDYLKEAYQVLYQDAKRRGDAPAALANYEHFVAQERRSVDDTSAQALAYQTVQQQVLARTLESEELGKQNSILQLKQALDAKAMEASRLYLAMLLVLLGGIIFWLYRLKRSQLRFKKLASHDGLTGILNHQHFITACERALHALQRRAGHAAMVSIDLDHFKQINDTHGHAAGDSVLKQVVQVCIAHLRPGDLFGRMGGEEFGILLMDCGREPALAIADRMRETLSGSTLAIDGGTVNLSASAGVALTDDVGYNLMRLCRQADAALYRAKHAGRNRVVAGDSAEPQFRAVAISLK